MLRPKKPWLGHKWDSAPAHTLCQRTEAQTLCSMVAETELGMGQNQQNERLMEYSWDL
jgi:hypothetical protein